MSWAGHRVFCNPPYGRGVDRWLAKAREADCAVYLLPARTDTAWWHDHALKADEIRFVRGRLKFGGAQNSAPFPSVILIYGQGPA
jgi:site-specific DNA-methyltransferase (adenine-specific)